LTVELFRFADCLIVKTISDKGAKQSSNQTINFDKNLN